jgi:hypothetical protein
MASTLIIVGGLIYAAIMFPLGYLNLRGVAVFVGSAIVAALIVPNAASVSHLVVKAGEYFSITTDMHQDVTDVRQMKADIQKLADRAQTSEKTVGDMKNSVQSDVNEIKTLKEQTATLAQTVQDSQRNVAAAEAQVMEMRDYVRRAYFSLWKVTLLTWDFRSMFPAPPEVIGEVNKELVNLAQFAFLSQPQFEAEYAKIKAMADRYFPPAPTATPKATVKP